MGCLWVAPVGNRANAYGYWASRVHRAEGGSALPVETTPGLSMIAGSYQATAVGKVSRSRAGSCIAHALPGRNPWAGLKFWEPQNVWCSANETYLIAGCAIVCCHGL